MPPRLLHALEAAAAGREIALVGGAVRDLLLHRVHCDPWRGLPDLDLVVEGSAAELVERLAGILPPGAVRWCRDHGAYGTVELELQWPEGESWLLDVATARREHYPQPGHNPEVLPGLLADDLARRDFTVNAMALCLSSGALLDPHGGQRDLAQRELRLLHEQSVRDDPTRLLRAARYAARLGFVLAAASGQQVVDTLSRWPWDWRPGDPPELAPPALASRLRMELNVLLSREPWGEALAALQDWGGLVLLDAALQNDRHWRQRLSWAQRFGVPLIVALLAQASDPCALARRLQLPHQQQRSLRSLVSLRQWLAELESAETEHWSASAWTQRLEAQPDAALAVPLALACGDPQRRPLLRWWLRWRHVGPGITAQALLDAGMRPGPALGERLRELRAERLDAERI